MVITLAVALWTLLVVSVGLGIRGVERRSAWMLLVAGAIALGWSWAAMMSVGRFTLILPLLELAGGVGLLLRSRRGMVVLLCVAVLLYGLQLAML